MQAGDGTNPRARLYAQQREHNLTKARESEYARENLGKYLGKQGALARRLCLPSSALPGGARPQWRAGAH